jgi:nitroreductase
MDIDGLLEIIRNRRVVRAYTGYKPDPIPDEYIQKILEAGRWAPSGSNSQPWEFIVVTKKDVLEQICKIVVEDRELNEAESQHATFGGKRMQFASRAYFKQVPAIIVVLGDPRYWNWVPGGGEDVLLESIAAAVENMLLAAAALGLGSVWYGPIPPHPNKQVEQLKDVLGVPKQLRIIHLLPLGFPSKKPKVVPRKPLSEIVHYERYDQKRFRSDKDMTEIIPKIREEWWKHIN